MPILKRLTRHTVGDLAIEVVLIVLGITGALWLDGVKDARNERRLETSLLRELVHTLESDTTDFRTTVNGLTMVAAALDTVLLYMDEERAYTAELDDYLLMMGAAFGLFPNGAAYESLRSAGLQIVQSDSLRQHIVRYYDFQVPAARIIEEMRVFPYRTSVLLPQLMGRLVYVGSDVRPSSARPNDYTALLSDPEFRNVLRIYRVEMGLQSRLTNEAHQGAQALLREVEAELARRSR